MNNPLEKIKCPLSLISSVLILTLLVSCASEKKEQEKTEITWEKLPAEATVEVVSDREKRNIGLMYREYLQKDSGMYFIMEEEQVHSFWMKDTRIPLSIAFIDSKNIISSIKDMEPYDTRRVSSDRPAKYALEMNRGWFREKGIQPGDRALLEENTVIFHHKTVVTE